MNNSMRNIKVDKVVLHICAGEFGPKLDKAKKVLQLVTGSNKIAETKAKIKLPKWGLRPGLVIGAKITLRHEDADKLLKRALKAKGNSLDKSSFDNNGNFAFGIKEYIDIEGMKYDPQLGILGFDVMVNLKRNGLRVKDRRINKTKIGKVHKINKEDAQEFMVKNYNVVLN